MTSYTGPATAVAPDGTEAEIGVELFTEGSPGGLRSWGGSGEASSAAWDPTKMTDVTLRLPGGREATAVIASAWSAGDHFELTIAGSGPPPFNAGS